MSGIDIRTWVQLNAIFEWLSNPWLIVLPLLVIVTISLMISSAKGKKWLTIPAAVLQPLL